MNIEYRYEIPINSNYMSKNLYKKVKTEYWTMPLMSIVGDIGGALSMFLEFSFYCLCKWFMKAMENFLLWNGINDNLSTPHEYL